MAPLQGFKETTSTGPVKGRDVAPSPARQKNKEQVHSTYWAGFRSELDTKY